MAAAGRLLWLTEHHPPARGGMAQSCQRIIEGLAHRGWTIDVLHLTPPHRSLPGRAYRSQRTPVGSYRWVPSFPDPYHGARVAFEFILRDTPVDAIIAFGGRLPAEIAPALAAFLDRPLILALRGNDFDLGAFRASRRAVLGDAIAASRAVCTVTAEMADRLGRLYPGTVATVVANGIDLDEWQPLPSEQAIARAWREEINRPLVVALIGHLKDKKGAALLVRAVLASGHAGTIHLLLIGETDEHLERCLTEGEELAYTCKPFLDRGELVPWYLAADVVALPSFYDGLPNVMLEALGLGRPLLAARVGGMADHLVDGIHGLLFEPGDFDGARRAVDRLVRLDRKALAGMGEAGRSYVLENLTATAEEAAWDTMLRGAPGE